jgi:hypothetical protein
LDDSKPQSHRSARGLQRRDRTMDGGIRALHRWKKENRQDTEKR